MISVVGKRLTYIPSNKFLSQGMPIWVSKAGNDELVLPYNTNSQWSTHEKSFYCPY